MLAFVHDLPEGLVVREDGIACQLRTNAACRTKAMADDAARLVQFLTPVAVAGGRILADVIGTVLGKSLCDGITGPCEATTQRQGKSYEDHHESKTDFHLPLSVTINPFPGWDLF